VRLFAWFRTHAWRLVVAEDGPTGVEYGIMLGLVILAIFGSIQLLGNVVSAFFTTFAGVLEALF